MSGGVHKFRRGTRATSGPSREIKRPRGTGDTERSSRAKVDPEADFRLQQFEGAVAGFIMGRPAAEGATRHNQMHFIPTNAVAFGRSPDNAAQFDQLVQSFSQLPLPQQQEALAGLVDARQIPLLRSCQAVAPEVHLGASAAFMADLYELMSMNASSPELFFATPDSELSVLGQPTIDRSNSADGRIGTLVDRYRGMDRIERGKVLYELVREGQFALVTECLQTAPEIFLQPEDIGHAGLMFEVGGLRQFERIDELPDNHVAHRALALLALRTTDAFIGADPAFARSILTRNGLDKAALWFDHLSGKE